MRTIPRIVVAVVALMLMAPAAAADQGKGSGDGRPSAVPAVNVSGSTGGELVGDWYAQNLALPADRSPFGGAANLCLNLGRHGRVLSPAAGLPDENGNLEMKCSVEVGRPVLMVMTSRTNDDVVATLHPADLGDPRGRNERCWPWVCVENRSCREDDATLRRDREESRCVDINRSGGVDADRDRSDVELIQGIDGARTLLPRGPAGERWRLGAAAVGGGHDH